MPSLLLKPFLNHLCLVFRLAAAMMLLSAGVQTGAQAAYTFSFQAITNNDGTGANGAAGANQLFVEVSDPSGAHNVLFTFRNTGPALSSLTEVYFDDDSLLALSAINNSLAGTTRFVPGATPANLPGGNNANPSFYASTHLSVDAIGNTANGLNPGERFSILYTLQGTQEFSHVLSELQDGGLRIGLHVRAFQQLAGQNTTLSESFVNTTLYTPQSLVPEPSTLVSFAVGALLLIAAGRRRKAPLSDVEHPSSA